MPEEEKREKVGGHTLAKRHIAETRKFDAETEYLLAEKMKLEKETTRLHYEGRSAEIDFEDSLFVKGYNDSIDSRHRTYNLVGDIDEDTIEELVQHINAWGRQSNKPITIRVNSPGGSVYAGLALYDQLKAIDKYKAPVTTVAMGMTASMAGIITQGGRRRLITPSATFLIHEVSISGMMDMTRSQVEDMQKSMDALNSKLYTILAQKSTLSIEEISKNAERKDWELNAEQAVQLGFADEVGYE